MSDYRHRCTTAECPYLGQLTDNLSCGCHRKEAEIMREKLDLLTTPRPIDEYHEDMGPVLWWCLNATSEVRGGDLCIDLAWLGEPPYVGSPNDLGITVEAHVRLTSQLDQEHEPEIVRRTLGGWPGYHTHFTPLPPMPKVPHGPVAKA